MFVHELLPFEELATVYQDTNRSYVTPIGVVPSVTTVLKKITNKDYLKEWRKNVGDAEADRITNAAQSRGDAVHHICENYLMNREWKKGSFALNLELFFKIKSSLDRHVTKVYATELPLWSKDLNTAGRSDVVAEWDNIPTILDYKTVRRPVQNDSEKLRVYKLQATTYALMVEERYNLKVPKCGILIMASSDVPKIVLFSNEPYRATVRKIFQVHNRL